MQRAGVTFARRFDLTDFANRFFEVTWRSVHDPVAGINRTEVNPTALRIDLTYIRWLSEQEGNGSTAL